MIIYEKQLIQRDYFAFFILRYDCQLMPTDFDTIFDRKNTNSLKWDAYPPDVLPLWVADMDFRTAEPILRAMHDRIAHGIFGYESDLKELRNTFVNWVYKRYHWKIQAEEIIFVPGVVTGLNLAARALTSCGDALIIQTPVYPPFFGVAHNADLTLQQAKLSVDSHLYYQMDFDNLKKSITAQSKLFILCNPHNPVGRVFSREELQELAEICLINNLIIFSDEIHCDLTYEGQQHIPIAALNEEVARNTLTFMAPSKTFNIAGLKCSMIIVQNTDLRKKIERARAGLVGEPTLLAMSAALAAYRAGAGWLKDLINYLQSNRDFLFQYIMENIPQIKILNPQGTYLAWLQCRDLHLKSSPFEFFLNESKVALTDGQIFGPGGEEFVRLNFGCPRSILIEALERMENSLSRN